MMFGTLAFCLWCTTSNRNQSIKTSQLSSIKEPLSSETLVFHDDERVRQTTTLENGMELEIISRSVPITDDWTVKVWEMFKPSSEVEKYWQHLTVIALSDTLDPFGLVTWPGSVIAAQEMLRYRDSIQGSTVLVLGAGPGVEAQAIAALGASKVVATDIHPTTLHLVDYGAKEAGLDSIIETQGKLFFSAIESIGLC
uniref:Uncharacterized protein n=1 Tax=Cyclophora tenuis TaxID=216820 RepID=A0A7S1D1M2_CYCTE